MVNCLNVKLGYILGYIFNFGKIAGLLLIIAFGIYGLFIGGLLYKIKTKKWQN